MSQEPQDKERVEESEEDATVFVVDPEDYQKTRKLKAINDAKAHVRSIRESYPTTATSEEFRGLRRKVCESVAVYGSELLPLIEDAIEKGAIEEELLETPTGASVEAFILRDGRILDEEERPEIASMDFAMMQYRQLQRIERELGLGLELGEDKGPAQI